MNDTPETDDEQPRKRMSARERFEAEHGPDATPPRQLHRAIILILLMLMSVGLAGLIAFGGPHLGN